MSLVFKQQNKMTLCHNFDTTISKGIFLISKGKCHSVTFLEIEKMRGVLWN